MRDQSGPAITSLPVVVEENFNRPLTIEEARYILLNDDPYFAYLLQNCTLKWDERAKTAFITPKAELLLVICKSFWDTLPGLHRVGLLIHEMFHLLNEHLVRARLFPNQKAAWIAQDIGINQYIKPAWLPNGAWLPEILQFPKNLPFEAYYNLLNEHPDKTDEADTLDNHKMFSMMYDEYDNLVPSDVPAGVKDLVLDEALTRAYNETKSKKPGKIPQIVETAIRERFTPPKVNWRNELRRDLGRRMSREIQSSYNRINRRYGMPYPGQKRTYAPSILIGCDESGSVSDLQRAALISEIKGILPYSLDKIEIFFYDSEVSAEKLKINRLVEMPTRKRCGGTSFDAAIRYSNQQRPDFLIMLTDGEATLHESVPPYPILWVIVGNQKNDKLPGKKIYLDDIK
jgi:predicted metal-dependent peptidase